MNEENNLEKQVKERGIIIIGASDKIKMIKEKYKDLMNIVDYEEGKEDLSHVIYLVPGVSRSEAIENVVRIEKEQEAIVVVGRGSSINHGQFIEELKFPEIRKITIEDLIIKRSVVYLFEERLNKYFRNKYKSRIIKSQINYKKR